MNEQYIHPRTHERIIGHRPKNCQVSKDELKRLRKGSVAFETQINRKVSRTFKNLVELTDFVLYHRNKGKLQMGGQNQQFKTVWYSSKQRRK